MLNDLFAFIATAIAGAVILITGFGRADGIAALLVAALMLYSGFGLLRDSGRVLLEAAPRDLDPDEIGHALAAEPHVIEVHDLHVWEVTSGFPGSLGPRDRPPGLRHAGPPPASLPSCCYDRFEITHSTLQVESLHEGPLTIAPLGREAVPEAIAVDVTISHPDKLLFPDDGISKGELAAYYERVAEFMLPHVRARPMSMQRFPDGIGGKGFFHKDIPDYFPAWIRRVEVPKAGGTVTHVTVHDPRHARLPGGAELHYPSRLALARGSHRAAGPPGVRPRPAAGQRLRSVRRAARWTGELLDELGLTPFAQVTGSKGIHVWTALRRRASFDDVGDFDHRAAQVLAERHPDELTTEFRKAKRGGSHPRGRGPQPLRADRGTPVRGAAPPACSRGHSDRVGRVVGLAPGARPLDRPQPSSAASRQRATRGRTSTPTPAASRGAPQGLDSLLA